jgi:hypothetical protein
MAMNTTITTRKYERIRIPENTVSWAIMYEDPAEDGELYAGGRCYKQRTVILVKQEAKIIAVPKTDKKHPDQIYLFNILGE